MALRRGQKRHESLAQLSRVLPDAHKKQHQVVAQLVQVSNIRLVLARKKMQQLIAQNLPQFPLVAHALLCFFVQLALSLQLLFLAKANHSGRSHDRGTDTGGVVTALSPLPRSSVERYGQDGSQEGFEVNGVPHSKRIKWASELGGIIAVSGGFACSII